MCDFFAFFDLLVRPFRFFLLLHLPVLPEAGAAGAAGVSAGGADPSSLTAEGVAEGVLITAGSEVAETGGSTGVGCWAGASSEVLLEGGGGGGVC